jgi:hypothetical protein
LSKELSMTEDQKFSIDKQAVIDDLDIIINQNHLLMKMWNATEHIDKLAKLLAFYREWRKEFIAAQDKYRVDPCAENDVPF